MANPCKEEKNGHWISYFGKQILLLSWETQIGKKFEFVFFKVKNSNDFAASFEKKFNFLNITK